MGWLGWLAIGFLAADVLFFGTLAAVWAAEKRRRKR